MELTVLLLDCGGGYATQRIHQNSQAQTKKQCILLNVNEISLNKHKQINTDSDIL